jgi:hypothetical protein
MAAIAVAAGGMMMICCSSSMALLVMGGGETVEETAPPAVAVPDPEPEVFYIGGYEYTKAQAAATCTTHGAVVATGAQLAAAQTAGADWCATGWLSDQTVAKYPINTSIMEGCGGSPAVVEYTPPNGKAGVNCYGIKPVKDTTGEAITRGFNATKWSRHD